MQLLLGVATAALVFAVSAAAVRADTPLVIGYTNVSDCVAVFTAKEEGFFAKRGLDVELRPMQNSAIEATSIIAGALQAGCNAPPVLLAAVDRGVGLVAISGASVSSPGDKATAVAARPDSGIKTAADFVGKKVGVSGIGSNGYVMFNQFLIGQHVDFKRVNYFEVPFPTQFDLLQRGTVDAVVGVVPFLTKILDENVGTPVEYLEAAMPSGVPLVIYIAASDWTSKNPAVLAAIRGALQDGTKFALAHQDKALQYVAQYTKQPMSVVQVVKYSALDSNLTPKQMQWWIDSMKDQGLTHTAIIPSTAIAK